MAAYDGALPPHLLMNVVDSWPALGDDASIFSF
jgi:hypothetical protein